MKSTLPKNLMDLLNIEVYRDKIIAYTITLAKVILILIFIKVLNKVLNKFIESFFKKQKESRFGLNEKKADTLSELLKSILRYVLYFFAAVWVFETIGFNIKTVIAVTSIAGVAVGFGAQNLVKDVITGFFILFEDQFAVGDYVVIEGMSGFVETLGLRVTKIRDFSGDVHIIPNGSITKVTNKSRGKMAAIVDITIAYEEDIDNAINAIKAVNEGMKRDFSQIVSGPEVIGVTNMGSNGVTIRITAKTEPMEQWAIERELRRRIKQTLDKESIKVPYITRIILDNERNGLK